MKLPGLFLLLALAFDEAQSESSSHGKVVCVKKDQVSTAIRFFIKISKGI